MSFCCVFVHHFARTDKIEIFNKTINDLEPIFFEEKVSTNFRNNVGNWRQQWKTHLLMIQPYKKEKKPLVKQQVKSV